MWIVFALVVVASALGVAQLAAMGLIPTVPAAQNLGEVGAAYGASAALISGVAVVVSLVWQRQQIRRQQAQLTEQESLLVQQTGALIKTSQAQTDAAESLQGQLADMSTRGRLDDYNRRLERFVEMQAGLDEEKLIADIDSEITQDEARARLGRLYLATLTILLSELERLHNDPALVPQAETLRDELSAILGREKPLLYLAVVPPPSRIPRHYRPSEFGRLMAVLDLFPFIKLKEAAGRAAVYREHFWPLRRT